MSEPINTQKSNFMDSSDPESGRRQRSSTLLKDSTIDAKDSSTILRPESAHSISSNSNNESDDNGTIVRDLDMDNVIDEKEALMRTGDEGKLRRGLKARHLAMISIGGTVGPGLFLGTAAALANGGPLGMFLGYSIVGSITLGVMLCLGELCTLFPVSGGHIKLASRFVDPALGFAMGWNYWYNWTLMMPFELTAAATLIGFWDTTTSEGVWIAVILVAITTINLCGARTFGEFEFWFASIKVITITGLIILGIVLAAGGAPGHKATGFQYWRNPGPFTQYAGVGGTIGQFLGFFAVLVQAAFAFIGTEIVAIAAGEASNPRRNIPRAIKRVYIRILLFYLGGTFVIGLNVPSNYPGLGIGAANANKSPFVIAIQIAGIKALPSIVNACILTAAISSGSSDTYTASRALYGMALTGQAPKIFSKVNRMGTPWISVLFCCLFGCLAFMSLSEGSGTVFGYFVNLTAACGLLTWWGISFTYIRFYWGLKAQGINRKSLPYWSYLNHGAFAAWWCIILISIILFFSGFMVFLKGAWSTSTFITTYLPIFLFPILWTGKKLWSRTHFQRTSEIDFHTGLEEIEKTSYAVPKPRTIWGKISSIIM